TVRWAPVPERGPARRRRAEGGLRASTRSATFGPSRHNWRRQLRGYSHFSREGIPANLAHLGHFSTKFAVLLSLARKVKPRSWRAALSDIEPGPDPGSGEVLDGRRRGAGRMSGAPGGPEGGGHGRRGARAAGGRGGAALTGG